MKLTRNGKSCGAVPLGEREPKACKLAKRLHSKGASLLDISRELAAAGYLNRNGRPYTPSSIMSMVR